MNIEPIRTDAEHAAVMARIDAIWGAEPGTPEHDELKDLVTVACAYEEIRWPIIEARIDEMGNDYAAPDAQSADAS